MATLYLADGVFTGMIVGDADTTQRITCPNAVSV